MAAALLSNSLWCLLLLPEYVAFRRALHDVAATQHALLRRVLRQQAGSTYGQRHGFGSIATPAEYQARVPLTSYEDYSEAITQIGAGQQRVLTCDPVLLLEPTSGSSAATKYIPITASLKAAFQRAIAPWAVDLFRQHPTLLAGQSYWSLTPVTRHNARTPGGVPIGFEEDSAYFGRLQRALIQAVLAVPPQVRLLDDMSTFRYVTLLFLLRSRSLALISVWNPTFLTLLLEPLHEWWPRLAADIAQGTLTTPAVLAAPLHAELRRASRPDPRRAAEIEAAFRAGGTPGAVHTRLWPRLRLISCWADAHAAPAMPALTRLFPQAHIQPKGLLATEGCVSLPLAGQAGMPLAVRSHFFEFLPAGAANAAVRPLLAHELQPGACYEVILTNGGGLYRYQLHDLVEVTGYLHTCPLLRFVGKAAHVSDRRGEKLHEQHVRRALDEALARCGVQPGFAMLAWEEQEAAYTLFVEAPDQSNAALRRLGSALEALLQENYHYRYCRDLGQLAALRVFRIAGGAHAAYLAQCQAHGQRAGDIKPLVLHLREGWARAFRGEFV